jgi:hypothetical protein
VLAVVAGANFGEREQLVQWDYHGGPNQRFRVFGSPIKPLHSDLVLDVANGSQSNRPPIVTYAFHGGPNQQFRIEYVPNPADESTESIGSSFAYRVVANHSGKVWDVEGASHENGAKLIQWDWHGGLNQQFKLIKSGDAQGFSFVAKHSGKVIDVAGASQDLGTQLIQWDFHGGLNQRFWL